MTEPRRDTHLVLVVSGIDNVSAPLSASCSAFPKLRSGPSPLFFVYSVALHHVASKNIVS